MQPRVLSPTLADGNSMNETGQCKYRKIFNNEEIIYKEIKLSSESVSNIAGLQTQKSRFITQALDDLSNKPDTSPTSQI